MGTWTLGVLERDLQQNRASQAYCNVSLRHTAVIITREKSSVVLRVSGGGGWRVWVSSGFVFGPGSCFDAIRFIFRAMGFGIEASNKHRVHSACGVKDFRFRATV